MKRRGKIVFILLLIIIAIPLFSILVLFLYSLKLDLSMRDALCYYCQNAIDKKTFVASDNTCAVEAPWDWVKPAHIDNAIICVGDMSLTETLVVIPYIKKDVTPSTLDEVSAVIINNFKKDVKFPKISKKQIITIANYKASMIQAEGVGCDDNIKWIYSLYILDTKDAFYHFICSAAPANSKYANKVFRDIVESFKVLPKKEVQKQPEPTEQK